MVTIRNLRLLMPDTVLTIIIFIAVSYTHLDVYKRQEIASAISQAPGIMFSGARSLIKMCYVMDMIVAFTMLILSICLIIVSFRCV